MLANRVKTSFARTEQLFKHNFRLRSLQSNRFATEASTPPPSDVLSSDNLSQSTKYETEANALPPSELLSSDGLLQSTESGTEADTPPLSEALPSNRLSSLYSEMLAYDDGAPQDLTSKKPSKITRVDLQDELSSSVVHGRAMLAPLHFPKTHGIPVATLHVRGHDHQALDLFLHFAGHAAAALRIPISSPTPLPTKRTLWTVVKGPFVHKKAQENFDRKVQKRVLKAWDASEGVVSRWIDYILMYPQPSIGIRIVRWHRVPLGLGREHDKNTVDAQKEALRLENVTDRQRVEDVAKKIVEQEMKAANLTPVKPREFSQKKRRGSVKSAKPYK